MKHRLLDSPLMCLFVVLSDQHLFLLLCNAPDFLWGTTFPHCRWFPWRHISGFAVKDHVTQSWEIRALDPTDQKIDLGMGMWPRVWDFVGTFRNPATVNSSNIYWALTYLFAGNSTVNQSLYPFVFSLSPWTKAYLKTSYRWTSQIKIIFCCCCLLSPFGVSVAPRLKNTDWYTLSPFRCYVSLFGFLLLSFHMFIWLIIPELIPKMI